MLRRMIFLASRCGFLKQATVSLASIATQDHPRALRRKERRLLTALIGLFGMIALAIPQPALAQVSDPALYQYLAAQSAAKQDGDTGGAASSASANSSSQTSAPANTGIAAQSSFMPGSISTSSAKGTLSNSKNSQWNQLYGQRQGRLLVKKPAEPNEFEHYVQQETGRKIKLFGQDLLLPSQRDFAVPATATVPPDYAINVGDTIAVNTLGSVTGSSEFQVDSQGRIFIPSVGEVAVAGVRLENLKSRIAKVIGTKYRDFTVSVSVQDLHGLQVYVTGFANNPGAYTVDSLSTMVNAVLAAGGPDSGGSFRNVELFRNGHLVRDFDLYALLRHGDRSKDAVLQNEDVLYIPPVGPQVAVVGSVKDEAIYEARDGDTVADLLADAGGPDQMADASRVLLYRLSDKNTIGSREIDRSAFATTPVEAGDIIQLMSAGSLISPMDRQWVTVRIEGEVNKPGNYYVPPNTPLSKVMTMAGGPTNRAFVYGAKLLRVSVREQQRENFHQAIEQFQMAAVSAPLTTSKGIPPSQTEALQKLLDRLEKAQPTGRLVLDLPLNATALPGDLIVENNDQIVIPPRIDTVGVFGAVYRPGSFLLNSGKSMRVRDYVERAGGTERAADKGRIFVVRANGDVMSRKNGAWHARVQPGDVIFVPVKAKTASLLDKIRDISQVIFQFGLSAAAVAAIQ